MSCIHNVSSNNAFTLAGAVSIRSTRFPLDGRQDAAAVGTSGNRGIGHSARGIDALALEVWRRQHRVLHIEKLIDHQLGRAGGVRCARGADYGAAQAETVWLADVPFGERIPVVAAASDVTLSYDALFFRCAAQILTLPTPPIVPALTRVRAVCAGDRDGEQTRGKNKCS